MFKNRAIVVLAALLTTSGAIQAQGVTPTAAGKGGTVSAESLVQRYEALAGGKPNAASVVNGLRTGTDITLEAPAVDQIVYETRVKYKEVPVYEQIPVYEMRLCPPPALPGMMCKVQVGTKDGAQIGTTLVEDGTEQVAVTKPGQPIKLTFSPGAATPMGFGNVDITLALTEARLRPNAKPAPQQLKDGLMEILNKRAAGEGWGEIAKAFGFDLK
jgi:hypothetical protein